MAKSNKNHIHVVRVEIEADPEVPWQDVESLVLHQMAGDLGPNARVRSVSHLYEDTKYAAELAAKAKEK